MSMLMPTVLDKAVVEEIAAIGRERLPAEACGVLLPSPWQGKRVWEMPNRSHTPHDTFELHSEDIVIALAEWSGNTGFGWESITIWHTHPTGSTSPSKADFDNRIPHCGNLLVAIADPPLATWF